jgi:DNA-binding transcriptional MerR regulator
MGEWDDNDVEYELSGTEEGEPSPPVDFAEVTECRISVTVDGQKVWVHIEANGKVKRLFGYRILRIGYSRTLSVDEVRAVAEATVGVADQLKHTAAEATLTDVKAAIQGKQKHLEEVRASVAGAIKEKERKVAEASRPLEERRAALTAELASLQQEIKEGEAAKKARARDAQNELMSIQGEIGKARSELGELRSAIAEAKEEFEDEKEEIALRRKDGLLWEKGPEEVVAHFGYLEDPQERLDYAIAVLLNRGEIPAVVMRVLHVGKARIDSVLQGAGVEDSPLENVRVRMGPRPDGYTVGGKEPGSPAPAPRLPPGPARDDAILTDIHAGKSTREIARRWHVSTHDVTRLRKKG